MRTLIWFAYFWLYLVGIVPKMRRAEKLYAQGQSAPCDEIVQKEVRGWASALLRLAGVEVQISGLENIPDVPVVYVSNHQGNFDIPILLAGLPRVNGIVSKIEVQKLPFIRTWMRLMGCVFLDRKNPRQSAAALKKAAENLENGCSMIIFPEGTRSKGSAMGEFKNGAFKMALKTGAPVVPVRLEGSYRIMEQNGNWIHPAAVTVKILPALPTAELSKEEGKALCAQVQEIIAAAL